MGRLSDAWNVEADELGMTQLLPPRRLSRQFPRDSAASPKNDFKFCQRENRFVRGVGNRPRRSSSDVVVQYAAIVEISAAIQAEQVSKAGGCGQVAR